MDLKAAGTKRKIQIAELEEWREKAYHSNKLYKERTERWHDKRIKTKKFKLGVPLVYRDSGLSGYPRHYLRVGDLPIIVSHSFTSLMLFVHLHTVQ
jgi:hypothetical protein